MERVNIPAFVAGVLLALVQDVAMDKDKSASLDLTHVVPLLLLDHLVLLLSVCLVLYTLWKLGTLIVNEASTIARPDESLVNSSTFMTPSSEA